MMNSSGKIWPVAVGEHELGAGSAPSALPVTNAQLVLWWFLASVTMLFAAFASAYLVRRAGSDWQRVSLPGIVWLNTVGLVVSSGTLEAARRRPPATRWLTITTLLGLLFLAGQVAAWRQLAARGVLLPSNPHGSFFYILTGLHGLHLLGGLVLLGCARATLRPTTVSCAATYWHFLAALWIGVLALVTMV